MIAPIFIQSETLSLKRNSKKTASVIVGKNVACNYCIEKNVACNYCIEKNVACNYCIEKTSRVIIALSLKNVACNFEEKNDECNGKKNDECLQSWPFSAIVSYSISTRVEIGKTGNCVETRKKVLYLFYGIAQRNISSNIGTVQPPFAGRRRAAQGRRIIKIQGGASLKIQGGASSLTYVIIICRTSHGRNQEE